MINTVIDIGDNFLKIASLNFVKNYIQPNLILSLPIEKNIFDYEFPDENFNFNSITVNQNKKKIELPFKEADLIIPDSRTYFQIIETPLLTEKELISAIRYHSEQFIPLPFEQVAIDMELIYEDKTNKKLKNLIVAAPKLLINKIIKLSENSNLIPLSIENETSAYIRLVEFLVSQNKLEHSKEITYLFFINLGFKNTTIFIFNTEKNIPEEIIGFSTGAEIFIKEISLNFSNNRNEAIEILKKMNFEDNNDLKIKSILDYSFNFYLTELNNILNTLVNKYSTKLKNIYYYGEASNFTYITQKIQQFLKVELKILDPDLFLKFNKNNLEMDNKELIIFYPLFGSILS